MSGIQRDWPGHLRWWWGGEGRGGEGGQEGERKGGGGGSSGRMTSPSLKCHHYLKPQLSCLQRWHHPLFAPPPSVSRICGGGRMFVCVHTGGRASVRVSVRMRAFFQGRHEWMFVGALSPSFMPLNWQEAQPRFNGTRAPFASFSVDRNHNLCLLQTRMRSGRVALQRICKHHGGCKVCKWYVKSFWEVIEHVKETVRPDWDKHATLL